MAPRTQQNVGGIDPRKMNRLYQLMLRLGKIETVTFMPDGRDMVDIRREKGRVVRKIYPATRQFQPLAKPYECIVVDKDQSNPDGVTIAKAIPLNPFDEEVSTKEWLPFAEYARRLDRHVMVNEGRKQDPIAFIDGKLALLHSKSTPAQVGKQNHILVLEDLWVDRMVVLQHGATDEFIQASTGTSLATLFEAAGLVSDAEREYIVEELVDPKHDGMRVTAIASEADVATRHRRVHVWKVLGDAKIMGEDNVLTPVDKPSRIKRAAAQLLAAVHPDSGTHPVFASATMFGGLKKAPFLIRRRIEARVQFLRSVAEAAMAIAKEWEEPEQKQKPVATEKPKRTRGSRGRGGRKSAGTEAKATEPAVEITTGHPAENDDWGTEPEATAQASETMEAETAQAVEEPAVTEVIDNGPTPAQAQHISCELQLEAVRITLADENLLPNKRKYYEREERRLLGEIAAAKKNAEGHAAKPKAKAEKPVAKGLGALAAFAAKDGSEG